MISRRAELSVQESRWPSTRTSLETNLMLGYLRLRQERLPEALAAFDKVSAVDGKRYRSACA